MLATVLLVWLLFAIVLSVLGVFHHLPVTMPILGAALTVVVIGILIASARWRERALAGGPRPLIAFHLTRFVGFYFLWLDSMGILPRNFAQPAGWGDILVALLAIPLLMMGSYASSGRRLFLLLWNLLGLLDILMVVTIANRLAIADPGFQNGFASLPLSLLPTFIVPLVIASHALIFAWLRRD